jgi:hypothetical protein
MRTMAWTVALAAGMALAAAPSGASAQQAGGWWDWALPEVAQEKRGGSLPDVIRGRDDRQRGNARPANAGPPFCQNGQGHPVHGRQWCRDKGFGTGGVLNSRWDPRGWDDVILRAPRGQDRRPGAVSNGGLIDILGDVVFGRLMAERSQLGTTAPLTGRWVREGGADVLQIRSGAVPVAELTDLNGNGRADAVLIARR